MTNEINTKLNQRQIDLLAYFASRGLSKYAKPYKGRIYLSIPGQIEGTYLSVRSATKDCDLILAQAMFAAGKGLQKTDAYI